MDSGKRLLLISGVQDSGAGSSDPGVDDRGMEAERIQLIRRMWSVNLT